MTLVIGGAQRDVRPWQCIPLPFGNDCDHTVFVYLMFILSISEVDSQPNVISHYGQVYISQKVCISGPMFIRLFFVGSTTSQNIGHFLTPYICGPLNPHSPWTFMACNGHTIMAVVSFTPCIITILTLPLNETSVRFGLKLKCW